MRPVLLSLLLAGCATSSSEMVNSPAWLCVSDTDPLSQCCAANGLDATSPSRPACPGAPLAVIERGGSSVPDATLRMR